MLSAPEMNVAHGVHRAVTALVQMLQQQVTVQLKQQTDPCVLKALSNLAVVRI